jgi:hypothetical protein
MSNDESIESIETVSITETVEAAPEVPAPTKAPIRVRMMKTRIPPIGDPSVCPGRIVLYVNPESPSDQHVAIITRVWSDGLIDLAVIHPNTGAMYDRNHVVPGEGVGRWGFPDGFAD